MAGFQKILLIEDNAYLLDLYSKVLGDGGYEVKIADGGEKGLAIAEEFVPDVIFLDIMMPGESGLNVLKTIRADEKYKNILSKTKIIMLTNLADDNVSKQAAELGADGYILKVDISPFDLTKIIKELEQNTQAA